MRSTTTLIGAIDAGTTGVRFALFDQVASIVGSAYREVPIETPRPGWVEQDPQAYLQATIDAVGGVLQRVPSESLAAIGIANQRETVVCWDRETGESLHPAIVWQDRRTAAHCEALARSDKADLLRARTGLSIDPYFSATKMAWLLEHVPGLRAKAQAGEALFGTIDSWLAWHLTGRHITDDTNACRTMLYDIHARQWDEELLELFDVPLCALPRVTSSLSVVGDLRSNLFSTDKIPVAGVLGDQQAALFGQGIVSPGRVQVTWGTGAFLLAHIGDKPMASDHGLLTTIAQTSKERATYALEGSVFVAGAAVQWLRDGLSLLPAASDAEAMARSVDSTDGVIFVPALTGLGAPHWDPRARGTLVGLTRGTRREHIVRAALEAIAFQTHDVVRAMEQDSGLALAELRVGGGAAANDFLCQFQSDILGIPVVRPRVLETTALGAAFAAGIAVGIWEDTEFVSQLWEEDRRFESRLAEAERLQLLRQWNRALERSRNWDQEEAS